MAVTQNTTTTAQISTTVREIDFVTRFERNWQALQEILGIMRPIRKTLGTKLVASRASVTLQSGTVTEGDEVPLSQATVVPVVYQDITLEKYRKRVTAEAVAKFGPEIASQKTDDAFINELTNNVLDRFYAFALTGTLTGSYETFQMAVSMAVAMVKDKFKGLHLNYSNIVVFANTLDVGRYLGAAEISIQERNGIEYFKNFLGASTVIVSSEIPEGKVVAIPADNINLYYIDPSDGGFAQIGLNYTTGNGATNLIGVHKEGVYGRVSGDTHAVLGLKLFAEYLDGIAVVTFGDAKYTDNLYVTSVASTTTSGKTKITVTPAKDVDNKYKYKVDDNMTIPPYGLSVKTWTTWDGTSEIEATSGKEICVVECDPNFKVVKAGIATVTSKA